MATPAKTSRCCNSPCGTYDLNGIRFLCGQCIREHLGPQLPSFDERLERFAASEAARRCSPASPSTFSSTSTVTAATEEEDRRAMASVEVDGPRRLAALGDARWPLSDSSMAPHLRRRPVERDS